MKKTQSGYTDCACRDCFEIAISSDETKPALCLTCKHAGCDATGQSECDAPFEYDGSDNTGGCITPRGDSYLG